jgi:hypothetical protein
MTHWIDERHTCVLPPPLGVSMITLADVRHIRTRQHDAARNTVDIIL